ncbi:hypothetical protein CRUP_025926 [Coryphaenoides rupestris]|nr:hypothetical protein CRUP_025926 [Coryphaenoides rupestris]
MAFEELAYRLNEPGYKNWLKAAQCLRVLREALSPYTEREMRRFHGDQLNQHAALRRPCQSACSLRDKKVRQVVVTLACPILLHPPLPHPRLPNPTPPHPTLYHPTLHHPTPPSSTPPYTTPSLDRTTPTSIITSPRDQRPSEPLPLPSSSHSEPLPSGLPSQFSLHRCLWVERCWQFGLTVSAGPEGGLCPPTTGAGRIEALSYGGSAWNSTTLPLRRPCQSACSLRDKKVSSLCPLCSEWSKVILRHHRQPDATSVNWENCSPERWSQDHWELAKVGDRDPHPPPPIYHQHHQDG